MTLAQKLPRGLTQDQVLQQGYELLKDQIGSRAADYFFYYDEDFPSDLIGEYLYLQTLETV